MPAETVSQANSMHVDVNLDAKLKDKEQIEFANTSNAVGVAHPKWESLINEPT